MLRIAIRCVNGSVTFDPQASTTSISQDGGAFIFENYDTEAHQPNPDDATTFGVWCPDPIPAGTPQRPRPTPSILNTVSKVSLIPYTDQKNTNLKGSINFTT
jgi:hypothetical protein